MAYRMYYPPFPALQPILFVPFIFVPTHPPAHVASESRAVTLGVSHTPGNVVHKKCAEEDDELCVLPLRDMHVGRIVGRQGIRHPRTTETTEPNFNSVPNVVQPHKTWFW